jgi:hypothetical protein
MIYIYYQEGDGKIIFITAHKDENNVDPCIGVEDSIGIAFFEGKQHPSEFFIDEHKQLTSKTQPVTKQRSLKDKIYAIPRGTGSDAELTIVQNADNKTLTVSSRTDLKNPITLVACKSADPVWLLWHKEIDLQEGNVSFSYTGHDDFVLYTRKTLKSYIHEKHS